MTRDPLPSTGGHQEEDEYRPYRLACMPIPLLLATMIAFGLLGTLFASGHARLLSWTCLIGQVLIGGYLLAMAAGRKSGCRPLEAALRESQRRFEALAAATFDGIAITDNGRYTHANEQLLAMLGYSRHELIGREMAADIPPEVRNEVLTALGAGGMFSREHPFIRKDGEQILVEAHVQTLDSPHGQVRITAFRDITERKRAEDALRQQAQNALLMSELEFRSLAEAMPQIVWATRPDGWNIYFNRQWVDYTGMTMEESHGHGWNTPFHPQDKQRAWEAWQGATQHGLRYSLECRLRRADGEYRWWLIRGEPMRGASGEILKWFGTCTDIEEIKRAEAALKEANERLEERVAERTAALRASERLYRGIGESINYGIWVCDAQGRNTYTSDSLLKLVGITREECAEFGWGQVLYPDDVAATMAAWKECVRTGGSWYREHRYRGTDGAWHPILACGVPIRDEQGAVTAWAGINLDISQLKQTEKELVAAKLSAEQARAAAESASKAKDQFIAVLSHELRTPLTPAVAALTLLLSDVRLPVDVREDLAMVSRNIDLEVRLIADLLDVSRIISGKLYLEKRPVDVIAAIREAVAIVRGDLDAKGQSLTLEIPAAPYLTFADAARLQQVFWNLLRNAIKFSPERGTISLRAWIVSLPAQACDSNGHPGNLVIEVSDQGSGIAPAMLPRIFDAFEQDPNARRFGGLGLGLSICKAVVEMHGGTISVRSEGLGCGATFTVELPVTQCPLSPLCPVDRLETPLEGSGQPPRTRPGPLRVLLVEDHADTVKVMTRLLRCEGFEVLVAGSVASGLIAAREGQPDVLISDIGLPDGSGLDLMRQLRDQGHAMPAIALSGYGTAADIEESRAAGFAEHLVKPLGSMDVLMAVLSRLGVGRESAEI